MIFARQGSHDGQSPYRRSERKLLRSGKAIAGRTWSGSIDPSDSLREQVVLMTCYIKKSLVVLILLMAGAAHSHAGDCSRRWFVMGGVEGSLRKVVASSKDEIWLSGRSSGLWHYDGDSLSRVLPETIRFGADALDVTGKGDIWIETHGSVGREQVLLHLKNGKEVHCSQTVECGWIQDIDMINEDEGWAVGNNGALLRCSAHNWEIVDTDYSNYLYDVEFLDASYGWIVGTEGFLGEYDGGEWKVIDQGLPSVNFRSVSIVRRGDVWVVGDKGTILHLSNGTWNSVDSPTRNNLHCIEMTGPEHGWIGSFSGEIAEYQDSRWRLCKSPVSGQINGLDVCQGNVWFVLRSGEVVRNLTKEVPQFRDGTIDYGLVYKGAVFSPHVVDLNGDGREDLYVETRDEEDLVYINRGNRFEKPVGGTGIERSRVSGFTAMLFSVSFGDYEGDGDIDCFMVDPHSREVFKLFLNDGAGNFMPRNRFVGTDRPDVEDNSWNSLKFVDFGGSPGSSIFFTSCAQYNGPINSSSIFNVGEDLLLEAQPTSIGNDVGFLAFTFGDLNDDGYVDAITMSTGEWCDLSAYINRRGVGFDRKPISVTNRPSDCYDATSLALADLNNDMMLDIIMVEQKGGLRILLQTGELEFTDHTRESGLDSLTVMSLYYPPAIGDLDNDGDLDIGYFPRLLDYREIGRIYQNDGHARFEDVSAVANIEDISGLPVFLDCDGDGDLDMYVAHESEAARKSSKLFVNLHDRKDFMGIDVRGARRDFFAIGATVKLFDEGHLGEHEYFRGMRIAGLGDNPLVTDSPGHVHFGAPDGKYDIEVTFPGGKKVVRRGVPSGCRVTIHEEEWPSRDLLVLRNAIDTFRAKEAVLANIMIFVLLSSLLAWVLKRAGGVLLRERALAFALFALLALVFFYLKYRWIDYGFFRRVGPSSGRGRHVVPRNLPAAID